MYALPPPELMFRVSGGTEPGYFLSSGQMTLEDFKAGLARIGSTLNDFERVLDFGCGCGRVMRWLACEVPPERIAGSDIDAPAIEWLARHIPSATLAVNPDLPPLAFDDQAFDLVLSYSVFSHLDERYQSAWLSELRRVTKPGAVLLLTVHGMTNWTYTRDNVFNGLNLDTATMERELSECGLLYWTGDGWDVHFPKFYHTAWHTTAYIRQHWSRWFDVVDIIEGGGRPTQDLVVLRRH
jgi:cyclopropane fatty-acyl-phospholipid synthase-like methyltransferase